MSNLPDVTGYDQTDVQSSLTNKRTGKLNHFLSFLFGASLWKPDNKTWTPSLTDVSLHLISNTLSIWKQSGHKTALIYLPPLFMCVIVCRFNNGCYWLGSGRSTIVTQVVCDARNGRIFLLKRCEKYWTQRFVDSSEHLMVMLWVHLMDDKNINVACFLCSLAGFSGFFLQKKKNKSILIDGWKCLLHSSTCQIILINCISFATSSM